MEKLSSSPLPTMGSKIKIVIIGLSIVLALAVWMCIVWMNRDWGLTTNSLGTFILK